jgi:hypothetical protein
VASHRHPFWTTAGQKVVSISAIFLAVTLCSWEETRHRRTEEDRLGDGSDDRKVVCTALHEANDQQVEETMMTLSKGAEGFYE